MLDKRRLGSTELQVPAIVLGANVFGWTVSEAESFPLLDRAFDLGLRFIDTADVYSHWVPGNRGGESETILGKWFAGSGKRKDVILATKVGLDMGNDKKGLGGNYILQAAEDSLRRLKTDYIDLYFSHTDDPTTPFEKTFRAYERLIREGKVRFIGASNYTGSRLREALEASKQNNLPRYDVLEPHYNLMERKEYESDLAPVVKQYGLGVTPYYGLASGFLSGKYRSESDLENKARGFAVKKYLNPSGLAVIEALDSVAREYNCSPASVALAWLKQQPTITSAIASATSKKQLESLAEAAKIKLDAAAVKKLTNVSGKFAGAA